MKSPPLIKLGITIFVLIVLGPITLALATAISYSLGLAGALSEGFTLSHWTTILRGQVFWGSIGYSIYIAVTSILISVLLSLFTVVTWTQKVQNSILGQLMYLPLVFPASVSAFIIFEYLSGGGLFSRIGFRLGLISTTLEFPVITNDKYGIGIIVATFFMIYPFFTVYFSAIYKSERIDKLLTISRSLGLDRRIETLKLTVPILLKKSKSTIMLYTMFIFSSYEIPLLLGKQSTSMFSVEVIRNLHQYNIHAIPEAYVMCISYTLLVIVFLLSWKAVNHISFIQRPRTSHLKNKMTHD